MEGLCHFRDAFECHLLFILWSNCVERTIEYIIIVGSLNSLHQFIISCYWTCLDSMMVGCGCLTFNNVHIISAISSWIFSILHNSCPRVLLGWAECLSCLREMWWHRFTMGLNKLCALCLSSLRCHTPISPTLTTQRSRMVLSELNITASLDFVLSFYCNFPRQVV